MGRDNIIVLFGVRMDVMEIIKSRKSVRTFDGEKITDEDKEKLINYTKTIENPYGIPVEFVFIDSSV